MKTSRCLSVLLCLLVLLCLAANAGAESPVLTLGHWEGQALTWHILAEDGSKALLLADRCLASQPYHQDNKAVTWETCTLRSWLAETFYTTAFTPAEAAAILPVNNPNPDTYGTAGGNDTVDTVFILSRSEMEFLIPVLLDRKAGLLTSPDPAAKAGTTAFESAYDGATLYWLRSPGVDEKHACCVSWSGVIESHATNVQTIAVRPAIWIDRTVLGQ
ncbi:MAG: hypothetical protein IJ088_08445 [Clostridia bacterium]|nr:hypothetical protein [Clostridia bacterium]